MDEIETANEEGKYRTKENWLIRKVINENKNKNAEEIIVWAENLLLYFF